MQKKLWILRRQTVKSNNGISFQEKAYTEVWYQVSGLTIKNKRRTSVGAKPTFGLGRNHHENARRVLKSHSAQYSITRQGITAAKVYCSHSLHNMPIVERLVHCRTLPPPALICIVAKYGVARWWHYMNPGAMHIARAQSVRVSTSADRGSTKSCLQS